MQRVSFQCLKCDKPGEYFPNQKWCSCGGHLVRVDRCMICFQDRATEQQMVCEYCEPIVSGLRLLLTTRSVVQDGGWLPVTPNDMRLLVKVVYDVIKAKWDPDAEGDLPVEPRLVDRTRYGFSSGRPLPHLHQVETMAEMLEIVRVAATNVDLAMVSYKEVSQYFGVYVHEFEERYKGGLQDPLPLFQLVDKEKE